MVLTIGSWFGQPEIDFKISHKVINLIREGIILDILKPKGIYNENDNEFIGIQITTKKEIEEAYLDKPTFDKKNNFTNYNFWLPYYIIKESSNELESFIKYFFSVLEDFLMIYNIPSKDVKKLKTKIEYQVINNNEYKYKEEEDGVNITDILKGLDID